MYSSIWERLTNKVTRKGILHNDLKDYFVNRALFTHNSYPHFSVLYTETKWIIMTKRINLFNKTLLRVQNNLSYAKKDQKKILRNYLRQLLTSYEQFYPLLYTMCIKLW